MKTPYITSEWKTLFKPLWAGNYVNDHTIYRDEGGTWHLVGITSKKGKPTDEKYFVHAASANLQAKMKEKGKVINTGTLAWAPCVVEKDGLYYMYYGPSPTKLAVSPDSIEWFGHEARLNGLPPMACHRDHFILKLAEDKWLMYASGIHEKRSSICCLESADLLNWDFKGFALTSGPQSPLNPSWGAFESPYVVRHEGLYYLFTTYTDCSKPTYHNTLVFSSDNPCSFGEYNGQTGAQPITTLRTHAPEIIQDEEGWHITTCGWRKSSFAKGAVKIAKLAWK